MAIQFNNIDTGLIQTLNGDRRVIFRKLPHISNPYFFQMNYWWYSEHTPPGTYDRTLTEIAAWLSENVAEGTYSMLGDVIYIHGDDDAFAFRMRWC